MVDPSIHTHFVAALKDKYQNNKHARRQKQCPEIFELILINLGTYDLARQILKTIENGKTDLTQSQKNNEKK